MRAELVRSGGFAGLKVTATVDAAALAPAERDELARLVAAAGFWALPATLAPRSPQADRFSYRLAVEDGGRSHAVSVAEDAVPGPLRPLIAWLEGRAGATGAG